MTGESRYCQNCGKESNQLFEVTQSNQTINQLQYCKQCKEHHEISPEIPAHLNILK